MPLNVCPAHTCRGSRNAGIIAPRTPCTTAAPRRRTQANVEHEDLDPLVPTKWNHTRTDSAHFERPGQAQKTKNPHPRPTSAPSHIRLYSRSFSMRSTCVRSILRQQYRVSPSWSMASLHVHQGRTCVCAWAQKRVCARVLDRDATNVCARPLRGFRE